MSAVGLGRSVQVVSCGTGSKLLKRGNCRAGEEDVKFLCLSGMYWDVLGCTGMYWDVQGCTGRFSIAPTGILDIRNEQQEHS